MISIETDTTDYHRSDETLRERENYLETIFDSVQTGLLVIDPETHSIFDVNPAAAKLIGLDRNKIIGSVCHKFICPEDVGKCPITDLGQNIENSEHILLKADGSRIPILKTGIPIKIGDHNYLLESFLDIGERKNIENALQESEAKFRDLSERALVGIYLIQDGVFRYVNPKFAEIHGYSVDEMVDVLGPKDVIYPGDCPIADENIRKRLSGESESIRYETRIVTKKGDIRSVELYGSRTLYQSKPAVVGTALDTTERKNAEEALREAKLAAETSQAQFEQVVSMISDVVWRHDINSKGEYIGSYISPVADRMLGLPDGTIGNSLEKFFSYIHPDDLPSVQEAFSEDTRALVKDFAREFRMLKTDGATIWVRARGSVYPQPDGRITVFGTTSDITERKRAEEALHEARDYLENLFNYANAPIIVWDSSFRITRFNHAFERLTQKSAVDVLGKNLEILFPENSKARSLEYIKLSSSGERWEVVEIPILRSDGSVRIVLWNSANIYDKDGTTILTTIAQGQDITERKSSEDAIKESERRLTEIIDFLPDATFAVDKAGLVIAWNRAMEEMTGIGRNDMIGQGDHAYTVPFYGQRRSQLLDLLDKDDNEIASNYQYVQRKGNSLYAEAFTPALRQGKGAYVWATTGPIYDVLGNRIGAIESIRDITERKYEQDELKNNLRFLETLIETIPSPIFFLDRQGRYLGCNDAFAQQIIGMPNENIIGKTVFELPEAIPPDLAKLYYEQDQKLFRELGTQVYEMQVQCSDGEKRDFFFTKATFKNHTGDVAGIVGVMLDVTKRKHTEETLRASHQIIEGIINSIPMRVFWKDKDLVFLGCNTTFAHDAGFSDSKDIIGKDDYQMGWRDQAELYRSDDRQVIESGRSKLFVEEPQTTPEGNTIVLLTSKVPLRSSDGEIVGVIGTYMDITERKQAEEALQEAKLAAEESWARYAQVVSMISDVVWSYDVDAQAQYIGSYISPVADKMLGVPEGSIGNSFNKFFLYIHPDDLPGVQKTLSEVIRTLVKDKTLEYRLQRADGTMLWVRSKASAYTQPDGRITAFGTTSDITELKQMEKAQRESKEFLDKIINSISDPIFVIDRQHRHILVNEAMCEMSNRICEEFIGKTPYDFFPKEQVDVFVQRDEAVFETGKENVSEEKITDSQGSIRTIITKKTLYTDASGNKSIVGIIMDITDRKKAEEALKVAHDQLLGIIDFLPDATFVIDKEGIVIAWNRAIEAMTDIRAKDILGKGNYEYAIPFYGERKPVLIDLLLKQIKEIEDKYTHIERKDEALEGEAYMPNMKAGAVYLYGKAAALYDSSGNLFGAIESIRDITDRKNAEQIRERLVKELESKNAEMERFTYTVSHDLRSPLITVSGLVGFLKSDLEKGNTTRSTTFLDRITNAIAKMDNLLKDTLELSRIGRVANPPDNVNFDDIVQDALSQVQERITKSGTKITVAQSMPDVFVDRMRIAEVMVNLIENGIKYMGDQAHPEIEIGYRIKDGQYTFFVKDNGMGIDPSQFDKVFELFYKVNAKSEGTGAGLAIVKRIIEVQGGRIWVESENGKGSTFCFNLPQQPSKGV